jgi:hypothetical protein
VYKLTPTIDELDTFRKLAPPGPVVMINLLKFKRDGGKQAYVEYASAARKSAPNVEILYAGAAGPDFGEGEDWDFVIAVRYESFAQFADFISGKRYQTEAVPLRIKALERTLFMVTQPASLESYLVSDRPSA